MQDLLHSLALESGQNAASNLEKLLAHESGMQKLQPPKPITVEELLNKPFYTVETNDPSPVSDETHYDGHQMVGVKTIFY